MPLRTDYPAGMPCWTDCITPDMELTRGFYGELFDWSFESEGERYTMIRRGGLVVGGLGASPPGRDQAGFWTTYLASKDLSATVAAIGSSGGQLVLPPRAAGAHGRLCLAVDPAGAAVGLWQGRSEQGIVGVDEPGMTVGHSLCTPTARILDFYRGLAPLDARRVDARQADPRQDGQAESRLLVTIGGRTAYHLHERPGSPARWTPVFGSASVGHDARRAVRLGATVQDEPAAAGVVVLQDPLGATFALGPVPDPDDGAGSAGLGTETGLT